MIEENHSNWDLQTNNRKGLSPLLFLRLLKDLEKCDDFQKVKVLEKLRSKRIEDIIIILEGILFESKYNDIDKSIRTTIMEFREKNEKY